MKYRNLLNIVTVLLFAFVALTPFTATSGDEDKGDEKDEVTIAKEALDRQLDLLGEIEDFVEKYELGRIFILKKVTTTTKESIEKSGLGTMDTLRCYQELVDTYKYSASFFKRIAAEIIKPQMDELITIAADTEAARGLNKPPYATKKILSIFTQIHELLKSLVGLPIKDELKMAANNLLPDFGNTLAIADQGDRPLAFNEADLLHNKLVTLYEAFNEIMGSDSAYNLVLEIQGLNELYAEFAQMDHREEE